MVLINRCSFWFDDIIWACFIGYKTIQRRKLVSEINRTKLLLVFVSSIKHISVVGFQLESWWNLDQLKRKNFMLVTWAESKLLKNWNLKKKKEISSYEKIKSINFIGKSISISLSSHKTRHKLLGWFVGFEIFYREYPWTNIKYNFKLLRE